MSEDKDNYEVGYGKPPKHSQWQKGQSGNSKGRPKGVRNFGKDLEEVLKSKVRISEGGRRKEVSVQRATLLRLGERALNGDARSIQQLLNLAQNLSDEQAGRQAERALSESEQDILDRFLKEMSVGPKTDAHGAQSDGK